MKRLVAAAVSLAILAVLYQRIGAGPLREAFAATDVPWLAASLALVVPLTLVTAWRLQLLMPAGRRLSFGEATRLILAASSLNLILPSKLGDIAKAYFMARDHHLGRSYSLSLVLFEKASDMLSLLAWCLFGLALYPERGLWFWPVAAAVAGLFGLLVLFLTSHRFTVGLLGGLGRLLPGGLRSKTRALADRLDELRRDLAASPGLVTRVALVSLGIWLLHLVQTWLFVRALGTWMPLLDSLALAPLAILAGLVPLTFAGVGTRDAAIVFLYRAYLSPAAAAALGVLFTARYLLPALAGLPLVHRYLAVVPPVEASER